MIEGNPLNSIRLLYGMASGKNHDRITFWCLPVVAGLSFAITKTTYLTGWTALSFLFSGLMFGPDLDIHSRQYLRWGWLRWLWRPYQRSIRHRSPLSHGPIIGTVVRILYVGLWLAGLCLLYWGWKRSTGQAGQIDRQFWIAVQRFVSYHYQSILAIAIGLELGAMSHYLADTVTSTIKQWGKRPTAHKKKKIRT
jgi:uncharacterized metal-binding protein